MPPERWTRIQELFAAAADLPQQDQDEFLRRECSDDVELRKEVESLLECDRGIAEPITLGVQRAAASLFKPESQHGKRIGPYAILRELGQGGMGAVYLAARADDQYQKQVAIKLVKRGMDTQAVLESFRHERQILANLDHPYIARLLDGGTTVTGVPYFVMEFVDGKPIDQFAIGSNLNVEQRCELFMKVCAAVAFAHSNLVVHRDLKPSNILVTADGTPKLLDFGIAKVLNNPRPDATVTAPYNRMLTPDYASPEQVLGGQSSTAMDVYSLGAIFYQLLTGVKPHKMENSSLEQVHRIICEVEPARPSTHSRQLAGDLDNIVLMAMRKEPQRRYASVNHLADDIQRYLNGLPVHAREATLRYRVGKFLRRHRVGAVAVALITISLLAGTALTAWQAKTAERLRRLAESERARAEERSQVAEQQRQFAEQEHRAADVQRDAAINERKLAEQQRQRAESRLGLLIDLSNHSLFEIHDQIESLPGALQARRKIVQTTLRYLSDVAKQAPGDVEMLRALANAYEKVGDIQGLPGRPSLGDEAGAMKSYRAALELIEQVLKFRPNEFDGLITRIGLLQRIGMLLGGEGKLAEELSVYREGLAIAQKVVAGGIAQRSQRDQTLAWTQVGIMEHALAMSLSSPDPEQAVKHVEHEIEVYTRLARENPDQPQFLNSIASACNQMAKILISRNQLREALAQFEKGAAIRRELLAKNPSNILVMRNLAISYGNMGDLLGYPSSPNLGDRQGAIEAYRKAERLMAKIVEADASNLTATLDLGTSLLRIGTMLSEPAQNAEAILTLNKALKLFELLATRNPDNLVYRQKQASAQFQIGEKHRDGGRTKEALAMFEKSLAQFELLLQQKQPDASLRQQKLQTLRSIALCHARLGDVDTALRHIATAQQLAREYASADSRRNGFLAAAVAHALDWQGEVYETQPASLRQACDAYSRSLAEWNKLPQDRYAKETANLAAKVSSCQQRLKAHNN